MLGTIGEIRMFGGNFAPKSWAFCDGQLLAISSNTALFSIIGCTYGGDCRTTFALPDMRGRSCLQQGQGPGLSDRRLGQKGGQQTQTLTLLNLPVHNHYLVGQINVVSKQFAYNDEAGVEEPDGAYPALVDGKSVYATNEDGNGPLAATSATNTLAAASNGGGKSFDIHSPYMAVNYIICMQGIFPSRN